MRHNTGALEIIDSSYSEELTQIKNIVIFAALTAIGAKVFIPHEPVPFTLQTLFVVLAGAFLGWRNGSISMLLYLAFGAAGVPVFAGIEAGPAVLIGPTAGYLFGFIIGATVVGAIIDFDSSMAWTIFSMLAGFVVIFACGTLYLNFALIHNWRLAMTQGFLIFSYWDLIKLAAAVAIYRSYRLSTRP